MYKSVFKIFKLYWSAYGGLAALIRSPYLHLAAILLLLSFNTWVRPICIAGASCIGWWEQSIAVLPNLLGFTLGGFAIFIGFGDEKFRAILAEPNKNPAPAVYLSLCSTFVHFILVQCIALVAAILAKSWHFYWEGMDPIREFLPVLNGIGGALGYGIFLYALTSVIAATMHLFRIANMYALFQKASANPQPSPSNTEESTGV